MSCWSSGIFHPWVHVFKYGCVNEWNLSSRSPLMTAAHVLFWLLFTGYPLNVTSRSLRSSGRGLLVAPWSRLRTKGDCALAVVAPQFWNSLPLVLRSVDTVETYKNFLLFLLCLCFCGVTFSWCLVLFWVLYYCDLLCTSCSTCALLLVTLWIVFTGLEIVCTCFPFVFVSLLINYGFITCLYSVQIEFTVT